RPRQLAPGYVPAELEPSLEVLDGREHEEVRPLMIAVIAGPNPGEHVVGKLQIVHCHSVRVEPLRRYAGRLVRGARPGRTAGICRLAPRPRQGRGRRSPRPAG